MIEYVYDAAGNILQTRDPVLDDDGDGVPDVSDCAPLDGSVYPGAPEINDGKDNQCAGDPRLRARQRGRGAAAVHRLDNAVLACAAGRDDTCRSPAPSCRPSPPGAGSRTRRPRSSRSHRTPSSEVPITTSSGRTCPTPAAGDRTRRASNASCARDRRRTSEGGQRKRCPHSWTIYRLHADANRGSSVGRESLEPLGSIPGGSSSKIVAYGPHLHPSASRGSARTTRLHGEPCDSPGGIPELGNTGVG